MCLTCRRSKMKFFIVFALFALAAAKPTLDQAELEEMVDLINRPDINPAIIEAIKEKIRRILEHIRPRPIQVVPEPVESYEPIHVGPEIVDFPVPESVAPTPPLVQIIVNVQKPEDFVGGSPVTVDGLEKPEPIELPTPVQVAEYNPIVLEPVIVADNLPLPPTPVQVADQLPFEPVNVAPIIIAPQIKN
ncbi:uncharacterized protein [Epargyreus clarus]|uniref:uncharacterized protein n=1 Tax=Epargyreus clarus TaxID=520877 RepID=UPI003C301BB9